jgi:hypothetical protein
MSEELPAVTLARIEGKLDLLHAAIQAAHIRGEDHETRIRLLEARPTGITPAKFLGAATGIGSVCASIGAVIALLSR